MNEYKAMWQNYVNFQGRIGRRGFWIPAIINAVIAMILGALAMSTGSDGNPNTLFTSISSLYSIAILLPTFSLTIRRLHDIGKSGWWILINLVPCIGTIVLFVFELMDSQPGENAYGPNPQGM